MALTPANTNRELIERFGKQLSEIFDHSLAQLTSALNDSDLETDKDFRKFLNEFSPKERDIKVAQKVLETFVHDIMASFDESNDFKIVGTLADQTNVDLRDLCEGGLHDDQLKWRERFSTHKDIYSMIFEKDFSDKT